MDPGNLQHKNSINGQFSNRKSPKPNLGELHVISDIQELYILH